MGKTFCHSFSPATVFRIKNTGKEKYDADKDNESQGQRGLNPDASPYRPEQLLGIRNHSTKPKLKYSKKLNNLENELCIVMPYMGLSVMIIW